MKKDVRDWNEKDYRNRFEILAREYGVDYSVVKALNDKVGEDELIYALIDYISDCNDEGYEDDW